MIFKYLICLVLFENLISQDEGIANYNNKEFNKSRLFYEEIIDGRQKDDAAKYGLGASLYKLQDLENAKKAFTSLQNSKSKKISSMANYNLGNIYRDENKLEESLSFYRKAILLNPQDQEAKINFELLKNMLDQNNNDQSQEQESSDGNNDQSQEQEYPEISSNKSKENENSSNEDNKESNGNNQISEENESSKNQKQPKEQLSKSKKDEKTNDIAQVEAILDALKGKERINQKIKISKSKSTKLAKNW